MSDINYAIDKINVGLGWDKIHANHLKFSGQIFRNLLCKIYNKFLSHEYLPQEFLAGRIKPVLKSNCTSKTDSSNFRPVMNSSNFLKVFEHCLLPFLLNHLNLSNLQFGFRSKTGCNSAIAILKETIFSYINDRSNVHCAMVDLSKAFDKINHDTLINKMRCTNLPNKILNIISFMLRNTFVNISCNSVLTDQWKVGNGTRQGGILSPLLFCFYINDALDETSKMSIGCSVGGVRSNIVCYADDVCLLAPSAPALQVLLSSINVHFEAINLKINVKKCAYMVFNKAVNNNAQIPTIVSLKGEPLERVPKFKYLGVFLSEDMRISYDVERAMRAFLVQYNSMFSRFHSMDDEVLRFLFRTYTSSFYGVELWYGSSCYRHVSNLAVSYHKAVKRVARMNVWDSNHVACDIVGTPIFRHLIAKRAVCFFFSLINSSSPCIIPFRYFLKYNSHIRKEIDKLFYKNYSVTGFMGNPLCSLLARISHVQLNEPRRHDTASN